MGMGGAGRIVGKFAAAGLAAVSVVASAPAVEARQGHDAKTAIPEPLCRGTYAFDHYEGNIVDLNEVALGFDCASRSWSLLMTAWTPFDRAAIAGAIVEIDLDDNPFTGCDGAEYLAAFFPAGSSYQGGLARWPSCSVSPDFYYSVPAFGGDRSGVIVANWPESALPLSDSFSVRGVLDDGSTFDASPDDSFPRRSSAFSRVHPGQRCDSTGMLLRGVYHDLLGRDADGAGLDHWTTQLQFTSSRETVIRSFVLSDEWLSRVVDDLYGKAFDRPAAPTDHVHWRTHLRHGGRVVDVATTVFASDEYFHRSGSTAPGFVQSLYGDVLGRQPSDEELRLWTSAVSSDLGRSGVAHAIYQSEESRRARVAELYGHLLGRPADAAGAAYWSQALLALEDTELAVALMTGVEYFGQQQTMEARRPLGCPVPGAGL